MFVEIPVLGFPILCIVLFRHLILVLFKLELSFPCCFLFEFSVTPLRGKNVLVRLVISHTSIEIPNHGFLSAVSSATRQFMIICKPKLLANASLHLSLDANITSHLNQKICDEYHLWCCFVFLYNLSIKITRIAYVYSYMMHFEVNSYPFIFSCQIILVCIKTVFII